MAQTLSLTPEQNIRQMRTPAPQPLVSGVRPVAPFRVENYIPDANIFETVFGTDLDSSNLSQKETYRWHTDPSYGYGGEDHRRYIANADRLMKMPIIPVGAAMEATGGFLPKKDAYAVEDIVAMAPDIAEWRAQADYLNDPQNQQKQAAYDQIRQLNEQYANSDQPHPLVSEVYNAFTAQNHDRSSPHVANVVDEVLRTVRSGMTGGRHEDDPSISEEEFGPLLAQYGEEANRMLTPGGVNNAKREMVYDFLSATQSGGHLNPHFDNTAYLTDLVSPAPTIEYPKDGSFPVTRGGFLRDPSAMRGRMAMANMRLSQVLPTFGAYDADPSKPYVVEAQNFNRLDPYSWNGLMALSENASWPYARNVYYPFQPIMGMPSERLALADGLLDDAPYEFQVDVANRSQRETPIRMEGQDYAQNKATRMFVKDRLAASADYLPTHARAAIADTYNQYTDDLYPHLKNKLSRQPYGWERTAYAMPNAITTSPPNAAMFALGAARAPVLATGMQIAKEGIDENVEDFLVNPGSADLFTKNNMSSWMRPYPPRTLVGGRPEEPVHRRTDEEYLSMFNPDNVAAWNQGVQETNERRGRELRNQYQQWQQSRPAAAQ